MSTSNLTQAQRLLAAGQQLANETVLFHQAAAERFGLNATDAKAGNLLMKLGPVPAGVLAEHLGLTPGAVTNIVDRLEQAGFVRRVTTEQDRRKVLIEPQAKRYQTATRLYSPLQQSFESLTERYSPEELELISEFLHQAAQILRDERHNLPQDAPI